MTSSITTNKILPYLFALQILLVLLPITVKAEIELSDLYEDEEFEPQPQRRSSWQKLHGAWGKRDMANMDGMQYGFMGTMPVGQMPMGNMPLYNENMYNENAFEKRDWKKLNAAWGKRYIQRNMRFPNAPPKRQETPNWNNLKGMWGKRSYQSEAAMEA